MVVNVLLQMFANVKLAGMDPHVVQVKMSPRGNWFWKRTIPTLPQRRARMFKPPVVILSQ